MSDNLVVDVSAINDAINRVNSIYNEASIKKYYIQGNWAAPLQMDHTLHDLRIEAVAIPFTKSWLGHGTDTVTYTYKFVNSFQTLPIVNTTYDAVHGGGVKGVSTRIDVYASKSKDYVLISVTRPSGKWSLVADKFFLHLIAIGY